MKEMQIVLKKNEERIIPFIWINGNEPALGITVRLIGEGASVHIVGIFLGSNANTLVFDTNVFHEAPNTRSLTTIRGVFSQHAKFSNDGLVSIKKGAKGADGYFASKIILFDDAKGRSVPSLEIDENDLKAGHASTVGRPDPTQLFYLQSRGLTEKQAIKLIVSGFFDPVLSYLPQNEQKHIRKTTLKELNKTYEESKN